MIVYATHVGGKYLPLDESLRVQPEGKRNLYVNITNHCNCACTFCLRTMKHMAEQSSLWFKGKEHSIQFPGITSRRSSSAASASRRCALMCS